MTEYEPKNSDKGWFSQAGSLDGSSDSNNTSNSTPVESTVIDNNPIETRTVNSEDSSFIKPVKGMKDYSNTSLYCEPNTTETIDVKSNRNNPASIASGEPEEKENELNLTTNNKTYIQGGLGMAYCSHCGSLIDQGNAFCSKCGASINNQTNSHNTAISLQNTTSLTRQLTELADNVDSLESVIEQSEGLKSKLQIPEPQKPRTASRWWGMKGFVISGIVTIVAGLYIAMGLINSNEYFGVGIAVAVIIGCVGAALIIIGVKTSTKRMENYNSNCMNKYNAEVQRRNEMLSNLQQQYNDLENTKADIVGRIQDCLMSNGSSIVIPENYFYSDAIRFFADRIATGRANTIAEAMDAYDEHLHRMRLEQAANEAAEYQRQSASNLAAIQREQAAMRRQGAVNTALHVANTIRHW